MIRERGKGEERRKERKKERKNNTIYPTIYPILRYTYIDLLNMQKQLVTQTYPQTYLQPRSIKSSKRKRERRELMSIYTSKYVRYMYVHHMVRTAIKASA
jgi:hypothetical protein